MKENKIAGVYKITNTITGEFYIGSSQNIKQRWANHKSPSRWELHPNVKLYKAFTKYGLDNFTFEIIEETADLKKREQYWIKQLKPSYNSNRAQGRNTDRYKETNRRCNKEYYEIHRDEILAYGKAYRKAHRDEHLAKMKAYSNRLCLYNGETLTLNALNLRLRRQGIVNSMLEAKKYLL